SGISGIAAAKTLVDMGVETRLIDIGFDDRELRDAIPDAPFSELRRTDPNQASYFICDRLQGVPRQGVRVGAQLTPPRQVLHRVSEQLLPSLAGEFHPLQSTGLGGLGAGWGAACSVFSPDELAQAGLPAHEFGELYRCAAAMMGVSADFASSVNRWLWDATIP